MHTDLIRRTFRESPMTFVSINKHGFYTGVIQSLYAVCWVHVFMSTGLHLQKHGLSRQMHE